MKEDLHYLHPEMMCPIRCENGCGTVIDVLDAFRSYERKEDGDRKLICQCCASEIGHVDEDLEEPEDAPVCKRKPKTSPADV